MTLKAIPLLLLLPVLMLVLVACGGEDETGLDSMSTPIPTDTPDLNATVEAKVQSLEQENAALKEQVAQAQAVNKELEGEIAALKASPVPTVTPTLIPTQVPPTATPTPTPTSTATPTPTPTPTPESIPIPITASDIPALIQGHRVLLEEYSPYRILDNVLVRTNGRLDIEAGTQVLFGESASIYVQGELRVLGEDDKPVVLTSSQIAESNGEGDETKYWGNIKFSETSRGTRYDKDGNYLSGSLIKGAIVSYGGKDNDTWVAVISTENKLLILDSKIENNGSTGIYVNWGRMADDHYSVVANDELTQDAPVLILKVQNSYILNNNGHGISKSSSFGGVRKQVLTVSNSEISNNSASGIYVIGTVLDLNRSLISGNAEGVSGSGGSLNIEGNLIKDNVFAFNYSVHGNAINLSNNSFINNSLRFHAKRNAEIKVTFNEFLSSQAGENGVLWLGTPSSGRYTLQVEHNRFENNMPNEESIGVYPSYVIRWEGNGASYFNNNDFISNMTDYLFRSREPLSTDVNAKGNWWGTDDEDAIKSQIYDYFQNTEYSIVDYSNWQTEPIAAKSGKVGVEANEVGPK